MADEGIFATTAEVSRKAGANASSTSNAEAYINHFMTEAESQINVETKYNWSDAYAGLDVDVKGILKRAASNLAAMDVINYDHSGFTSRQEVLNMLNVLINAYNHAISELKKVQDRDFMLNA